MIRVAFLSVLILVSIHHLSLAQETDFKFDMQVVALMQQLEGEWEMKRAVAEGKEFPVDEILCTRFRIADNKLTFDRSRVPDLPKYRGVEKFWTFVRVDVDANKVEMKRKGPDAVYHYVLIKEQDKVIMVHAVPKNTVLPKSLTPAAGNHYYEFCRVKPEK